MEQALVGLVGLLIGILLNEHFRRRNRVEIYSPKVFDRRLKVYEGLLAAVNRAASEVDEAIANDSSSLADRQERAFLAGHRVVQYADKPEGRHVLRQLQEHRLVPLPNLPQVKRVEYFGGYDEDPECVALVFRQRADVGRQFRRSEPAGLRSRRCTSSGAT